MEQIKKTILYYLFFYKIYFYNLIKLSINKEKQNSRFYYILIFAVGILTCFFCEKENRIIIILICCLFLSLSTIFIYFHKNQKWMFYLLIMFLFGFLVSFLKCINTEKSENFKNIFDITFEAKVDNIKLTSQNTILIVKPIKSPNTSIINKKVRIKYNDDVLKEKSNINVGDIVKINTSLIQLKYSQFPNDKSYENYAKFFDIIAAGTAKKIDVIAHSKNKNNHIFSKISNYIDKKRQNIQKRIYEVNKNKDSAGIIIAILTGNNSFISKEQLNDIRHSGCAHILAISGLHMSIITSFVFFIFIHIFSLFPSVALKYNTKKLASIPAMITCFIYLNIANIPISALRSCLMVLIATITLLTNRQKASLNALFITFFVMLITAPHYLLSPSFQMSFMAVFGLTTFYNNSFFTESSIFSKQTNSIKYLYGILMSSIIATISTIFFEIYHFKQYAWIGIVSNAPVIPITEFIILPISFIGMIFNGTFLGDILYTIAGFFANIICYITTFTAHLPYSFLLTKQMSNTQLLIIVMGIILLFLSKTKLLKFIGLLFLLYGVKLYLLQPKIVLVYNQNLKNIVFFENCKYYSYKKINNDYLHSIWSQNLGVKEIIPATKENKNLKCYGEFKEKNMYCKYSINNSSITIYQATSQKPVAIMYKNNNFFR